MKKILILILVLSLSLSVMVGCDKLTELVPGLENILPGAHQHNYVDGVCECGEKDPTYVAPHEHNFVEGKCECGEEDPNYVPPVEEDADLKAAYDYVHQNTKTIAEKTGANYKVILNAPVGSKNYAVVWEIIGTDEVVIEGDTVVVPEPTADINYTLKFTVTNEKGETLSREYSHIVPKFKYNTFAEYAAAEDEAPLVICGIVSGVFSKTTGSSANGLYIQDLNNEGGYYVYNLTDDPNGVILPGMTVKVKGNKDLYNGTYELIDAEVVVIDETIKAIEPIDYTELLLGAAALNDAALVEKQGMLVTVKGVTLLEAGDNGYYYFQAGNHKVYLRISSSNNATTKEALETIKSIHGANYGNLADITGVISLYNGNFYLSPVSADMISNVKVPERSDAEKIALELDALSLPTSISTDTVVELPLVGSSYDNVVITWTIDNADFTISEDGKLSIALGSSAVTLKLTATLTCGEATDSKEFTIDVSASLVMNESLAYVPYINQVNNGTVLYLDGGVSGRYLTTTTDASKAAAVYAEKAEGGYKFYILGDDGAKLYINIYKNADNKDSVNYDAAGETVFTYNKTVNAFVTNLEGVDVYLGIYNTFDTVSVSKLSYINAENTGVTQFPLEILPVNPGLAFNMFINQVTNGEVIYLDGGVNGRYLTTTTDLASAVAVYAEKVAGGFKFYILGEEGAKLYITIYNNEADKLSVNYDAAGESVYNYDPTVNAWVTVFGDVEYYLGTYSNFSTVSASKLSYINAENTGVSQFPLEVGTAVEGGSTDTPHEHVFVEGKCECGEEDPNYVPPTVDPNPVGGVELTVDSLGVASQSYAAGTATVGGVSFEFIQIGNYGDGIQVRDKNGNTSTLWNTTAFGSAIKEIVLVYSDSKDVTHANPDCEIFTFGNAMGEATCTVKLSTEAGVKTYTITPDAQTYTFFKFEHDLGYTMYWKSITIVLVDGSTVTPNPDPHEHVFVEGKCECGEEDPNYVPPTGPVEVTIPEALAAEVGTEIIVTGTVESFYYNWDDSYGNCSVYIVDEAGNKLLAFRLATKVEVGDNITVTGTIAAYNGVNQIGAGCTAVINPTDTPEGIVEMTITEALSATVGTQVKLTGTVCGIYNVWNDQYGNMSVYITDESGAKIIVYRTTVVLQLGDVITVTGEIGAYNEVNQIAQGNTVTIDAPHVCSEFTDATCTDLAACVLCGKTTGSLLNHNYVDGKCECGAEEGVEAITASKTMAELITELGWTSSTTKQEFALDDVISVKVDGGNNTGKAYNGNHIRIYATDTPAGTLTISAAEGYELVSIKITTETGTYAFLYVGEGTEDICNTTVAVSGSSVVLNSVKNGSDGKQVRVLAIEVTYKAA